MFTCVACTKKLGKAETERRREEEEMVGSSSTPSTKEAVKGLTAQIKEMALKFSGAYKQRKPGVGPGMYEKNHRAHSGVAMGDSNGTPYPFKGGGSSTETQTWKFAGVTHATTSRSNERISRVLSVDSISTRSYNLVLDDENEPKEWTAQVEPGVLITFMSLPNGGNDLKRIRFCRETFNKCQAQQWWGENYDLIMELYNVQRLNQQALHTPARSEEVGDSFCSKMGSAGGSPMDYRGGSRQFKGGSIGRRREPPSVDASRMTSSSRDDGSVSISNASDVESEWVEEDEAGVYITIRQLLDGTRELRRVRFSREKFGEVRAKQWWEENRERIEAQYL